MSASFPAQLPRTVRQRTQDLVDTLRALLGDDLVSIVVHGSAARDDWREGTSDIDVIVVLQRSSRALLERIANPLAIAHGAARIEPMILLADEIPRAADVFPLLYSDIRRRHVVLFGVDPFAELEVLPTHLRLRVEQELRDLRIRLRRVVVSAPGPGLPLTVAVARKVRQARFTLRGALVLLGDEPPDDTFEAILNAAGQRLGVDVAPLLRVREHVLESIDVLDALLAAAIQAVDTLDTGSAP